MTIAGRTILLVVNDRAWFWSHRLPLAQAILGEGATLHLAAGGAGVDPALPALGLTAHDLPAHTGSFDPLLQLRLAWRIWRVLRDVRPDLIHAVTLRHAFYAGLASRLARSPRAIFTIAGLGSLFTARSLKVRLVRAAVTPLLRLAFGGRGRYVIFQNPDDARALVRCGAVRKENCGVIRGSGVDVAAFAYHEEEPDGVPCVLFASRLLKAKGVCEFVHAARIVTSKGIAARFQIAGAPAPFNHDTITASQLAEWREDRAVEILGPRDDIAALMRQSALVVLPSYYGEGVPKVLLEAAATGRAIVTTDMPGCREVVAHDVNGLLVPPRDAWALASAIESLLADPARRAEMGRSGRRLAEENFTVEKVNARTLKVYARLFGPVEPAGKEKAAFRKAA